ncbi:MAG: PDC sensor domain-containing protein, partial [Epsilonproteobacteria bacterium]|nr:PDC sensor domain-containing protein [Campylobacterota bacterium]
MKKIIQIYKKDQQHIVGHIRGMVSSLPKDFLKEARSIFKKHRYIDMIYSVDSDYKQNSSSIYRHKVSQESLGSDKSQYFSNINLKHNDVFISSPYIHQTSGKPSISVVYRVE